MNGAGRRRASIGCAVCPCRRTCPRRFIWGFVFAAHQDRLGASRGLLRLAKPRAPIAGTAIDATAQAQRPKPPARTAPRDAHRAALDAAALATRLHIARRARVCRGEEGVVEASAQNPKTPLTRLSSRDFVIEPRSIENLGG